MEGQLIKHPLAELIREIADAQLSGALRLSRGRVKAAVYFQDGALIFASSNLRAHRLAEFLRRNNILSESQFAALPQTAPDDEVAATLAKHGILSSNSLDRIRGNQVSEVLRLALLWTEGTWRFDSRVRLADNVRVELDVNHLLLECARHLPASFITARFTGVAGTFSLAASNGKGDLLPEEGFVLSRATAPVTLAELEALSGLNEEQTLRSIYALSLAGYLLHSDSRRALVADSSDRTRARDATAPAPKRPSKSSRADTDTAQANEAADLDALFARLERATDHYEVLDVGRLASTEEIKDAYHSLARSYHPDRFHQNESELRSRVESAFARIAQAYETLSDQSLRTAYDSRSSQSTKASDNKSVSDANRAESSFQRGKAALQQNRREEALRFLAEAVMWEPREARYRAQYGQALIGETNSRRLAEAELKAAIALDPRNSSYRVILAELYKHLGLRRRAAGELERALAVDPKNEAARSLLSMLKGKA